MTRVSLNPRIHNPRKTHPLIWLLAIVCTVLAIAVIIGGLITFVGYLIIRPRIPSITISYASLDMLNNAGYGEFDTQITLHIKFINENAKVHVTFSDATFLLRFHNIPIAILKADTFDVLKNSSLTLPYVVQSSSILLEGDAADDLDSSLKNNKISFGLKGGAKTRWKIGLVGSVRFWTHLSCQLRFFPSNGSSFNQRYCT